ncbi:MAG TPA: hypothetical protein VNI02_04875 [Blastocatellia bacterium]|jgi:hypothetical protein|nr:hypothetical protein [Blastocatellia bacterium]
MRAVKFCSECGERMKANRASGLPFHSFCAGCAPRFRSARLLLIAALALCAAGGYVIGRYTMPRQPFYLIGTPIDLNANRARSSENQNGDRTSARGEKQATNSNAVESVCGAPTKSGRPCKRKVLGGGYCWQHRDKFGAKKGEVNVR